LSERRKEERERRLLVEKAKSAVKKVEESACCQLFEFDIDHRFALIGNYKKPTDLYLYSSSAISESLSISI